MRDKVSIIIPLYNRAEQVKETIQSVMDQTYPHWELVVVDDGSTDGSDEVVKAYTAKDERVQFHYRHREPKGAPTCRNIGLEKSSGEYVIFLDSDDLLAPWCLEDRVKYIKKHPELDMLIFPLLVFHHQAGDSNLLWNKLHKEENDIDRFLTFDSPWQTSSPIWKKNSLIALGAWDETLISWQDWELHIRAMAYGLNYLKIETRTNFFLRRGNSFSITQKAAKDDKHLENRIKIVRKVAHYLDAKSLLNRRRNKYIASIYYYQAKHDIYKNKNLKLEHYLQAIRELKLLNEPKLKLVTIYLLTLKLVYKYKIYKLKGLFFHVDQYLFHRWFYRRDYGLFHERLNENELNELVKGLHDLKLLKT